MSTVTLDTVDYTDPEFVQFLGQNSIQFRVVQEDGPAGGNPLVEYTGSRSALESMIDLYFNCSDGNMSPVHIVHTDGEPVTAEEKSEETMHLKDEIKD
jgi:hypothetical protein